MKNYIIFETVLGDLEQYSSVVSAEDAIKFLESSQKVFPDKHFTICKRMSVDEIKNELCKIKQNAHLFKN